MKNKHPVLRRFMRRKVSVVAAAVLILFVLIAILGPLVWQVDPLKQSVMKKYGPMTVQHPLGTDNLGRDTLARMIYGARVSLAISFAGVLSGALIGVLLGVSAGYFGGWVDAIISRFIDILLAFPGLLLAITIVAVLGPGSVNTVIAITIFTIPGLTRMVRSVVLSLKSSEYVEACKTMGESNLRIIFTHVIPNSMSQIIVEVKAVDGVSLALRQGETYGLVGESGCGKSTLGRTLIRLLEPTSGKITLFDQDITHLSKKEMLPFRRDVQIVFQDPYTSLNPRQRVGDMLMEVLAIHHIGDKNERMARALDIMAQVGLRPEHFYRYPHEFSGGQRQRIGLARALILDPKIVVCDEPVSALDVSIQSQIINLLKELQRKRGLTYLFVAHDMSVIRYISDRVGVMYLGHLVEEGDTDEVFDHPQHPYTRTLMSAVPSIDPRDNRQRILLEGDLPSPIDPPSGCVFHTRCPWATEACKTASCELREVRKGHYAACSRGEQE